MTAAIGVAVASLLAGCGTSSTSTAVAPATKSIDGGLKADAAPVVNACRA
ncbi:MAG: hypothetical protein IPK24_22765 [Kineosporiaceae bacterium]|nr:hypothetical protein [Kineosporiaceae bacterium]